MNLRVTNSNVHKIFSKKADGFTDENAHKKIEKRKSLSNFNL